VIVKLERNFSHNPNKYYHREINGKEEAYFNPFHSGQWTVFLYYMSYTIAHSEDGGHDASILADKIYYLNRIMNSCDLYHQVKLPDIFRLDHPVGTVMGRAQYSDGLSFAQGCTVGNNRNIYPVLGKNLRMCANSSIIGNCQIGDNVTIGANSGVKDEDIPSDSIVFGHSPNLIIKHKK